MLIEHISMGRAAVMGLVAGLVIGGCTKPNPLSCADGLCSDPAFPFCDVDGSFGDTVETCVAVACTPMEFASCRGDAAITCNAAGDDYELVQCERGCDATSDGCRLCDPDETSCTNGKLATCDTNGAVISSEACPLGCFEDEPRCRDIDPSNGLAQYLDMVADPPDLDLTNGIFFTSNGVVTQGGIAVDVPSFLVPAPANGVPIRVFVAKAVVLEGATISSGADPRDAPGPAFALLALGEIHVRGEVIVAVNAGSALSGCNAGDGVTFIDQDGRFVASGGGGGGNATDGAAGGAISGIVNPVPSAVADRASGTPALVPLRGGCSGGFLFNSNIEGSYPTGGAALQLSSATRIDIDGLIDIRGTSVIDGDQDGDFQSGGGAGGSLLVEAPILSLGSAAQLLAAGGNGAQLCATPTAACTKGGLGATDTTQATRGVDIVAPGASSNAAHSGGGGGGLGRIRVNTPTQTFVTANTAVTVGELTTGVLDTR